MKNKFLLSFLLGATTLMSTLPVTAADDVNLDNNTPAVSQGTTVDLNIESEATVKIPKNISFNINSADNNATFNENTNCYEYYLTISASGKVMDAESVFVDIDDSSLVFTNKTNSKDYFTGDIFYHNKVDDSSYDLTNLEGVWNKTLLEDVEENNRQKTLVIAIPSEVVTNSGNYQTTVNFNINKGTESSAVSSWATMYNYKLVGNGDAVILGFADSVEQADIAAMETMVIPKKIKTSSGVYAPVVGVETGAFKDNTYIKTVKIPADCALSVYTSGGDGDAKSDYDVWTSSSSVQTGFSSIVRNSLTAYTNSYKSTINTDGTTYSWREFVGDSTNKNSSVGAFEGCTNLEKVIFSGNVSQINRNTFKNCTKLASVEIPASCKWVGAGAFIGCPSLNVTATSNTKFAKFVHYITTSNGGTPLNHTAFATTSETTYENDCTTNILDASLTGVVFSSGVSRKAR